MKESSITIPFVVYTYDELSEPDRQLIDEAREATFRSYAPYSHFSVGAALRLANGNVVSGRKAVK